jgi:hypothetical protein
VSGAAHIRRRYVLCALAVVLIALAGAGCGSKSSSSVTVPADISALAVDGDIVAWEVGGDIEAWRVGTPRVVPLHAEETYDHDTGEICGLAVDNGRVAWLTVEESNHVYVGMHFSRIARPRAENLSINVGDDVWDVIGPVAGPKGFVWVVIEWRGDDRYRWELQSEDGSALTAGQGEVSGLIGDGARVAVFLPHGRVVVTDGVRPLVRIKSAGVTNALTNSYFVSLENGSLRLWSLQTSALAGTRSLGGRDLKTLSDGEGNKLLLSGGDGVYLYDLSLDSWTRLAAKGSWAGFVRGGIVYRAVNKLTFVRG